MKIDQRMTHRVYPDEASQEGRFRFKTNGNEHGCRGDFLALAESQAFNRFAADDFRDRRAGNPLDRVISSRARHKRSTRCRLFTLMNDGYLICNTCKIQRFIQSCIPAAQNNHRFLRKEGSITSRAAGNASAFKLEFAFNSESTRISPGSDDHALRAISAVIRLKDKRAIMFFDRGNLEILHRCAKLQRLRSHLGNEVSAEYPLRKAGIVFHLIRVDDLTAKHLPLGE